jgi:tetratricopeptide (TPR) repeat protein
MKRAVRAIAVPPGWDAVACELWAAQQAREAVTRVLASLQRADHGNPALALQAAYYLFLVDDHRGGASVLERQLAATPEHVPTMLNLAVFYARLGRAAESADLCRRVLEHESHNVAALDGLASALYRLGRLDEASEAGTRALEIKDRRCGKSAAMGWRLPKIPPRDFATQPGKRNVISYSLWGAQPAYLRGALQNLLRAPELYPVWVLRFHVDATVPPEFIALLRQLGSEVVMHAANAPLREKLCWRFQVANDARVGYFAVRDVDAVIGAREAQAVEAWMHSGRWFHAIRDWWTHTDLILAGMWGGVAGVLPNLSNLLAAYRSQNIETPNVDQWFLRDRVWPFVRQSCLVHDRCFHPHGATPMAEPGGDGDRHIGQDESVARGAEQERFLRQWIEEYPCLGPLRY